MQRQGLLCAAGAVVLRAVVLLAAARVAGWVALTVWGLDSRYAQGPWFPEAVTTMLVAAGWGFLDARRVRDEQRCLRRWAAVAVVAALALAVPATVRSGLDLDRVGALVALALMLVLGPACGGTALAATRPARLTPASPAGGTLTSGRSTPTARGALR